MSAKRLSQYHVDYVKRLALSRSQFNQDANINRQIKFVTNTTNSPCLLEYNDATHKVKCKIYNRTHVVHQCTNFD